MKDNYIQRKTKGFFQIDTSLAPAQTALTRELEEINAKTVLDNYMRVSLLSQALFYQDQKIWN